MIATVPDKDTPQEDVLSMAKGAHKYHENGCHMQQEEGGGKNS
jgi:hypothetical protein